jgi:hypothetical protein
LLEEPTGAVGAPEAGNYSLRTNCAAAAARIMRRRTAIAIVVPGLMYRPARGGG